MDDRWIDDGWMNGWLDDWMRKHMNIAMRKMGVETTTQYYIPLTYNNLYLKVSLYLFVFFQNPFLLDISLGQIDGWGRKQ